MRPYSFSHSFLHLYTSTSLFFFFVFFIFIFIFIFLFLSLPFFILLISSFVCLHALASYFVPLLPLQSHSTTTYSLCSLSHPLYAYTLSPSSLRITCNLVIKLSFHYPELLHHPLSTHWPDPALSS